MKHLVTIRIAIGAAFALVVGRSDAHECWHAEQNGLLMASMDYGFFTEERFGVRAIAQAPPKYDFASAGIVENAIKQVKEKVQTLVIGTRELQGVVMNPEHEALALCVCVLLVRSFPAL